MKTVRRFTAGLLVGTGLMAQSVKDPKWPNPVRISSRLQMLAGIERTEAKRGEPVIIHFHIKNASQEVLQPRHGDYVVVVMDATGAEPPRTEHGKQMLDSIEISSRSDVLAPGAELGELAWDLTKIYDLSTPGRYFVRALFSGLGADPTDTRLRSNNTKILSQVPIEEAVSDLIPFTITP
jgi:hypothetical protein